jgi:ABC-type uncharacterized transport system substrate-binding protein
MNKGAYLAIATIIILGLIAVSFYRASVGKEVRDTTPTTNDGRKWRIAYYEGGPYVDYAGGLRGVVRGLVELGWMEDIRLPRFENPDDTRSLWGFLAANAESRYVEFVADAYWSAKWDGEQRLANREEAIRRLAETGDIDLIIAMGTWAGQDLATDEHAVPTMVLTSSEPVRAGIIESAEDSGLDHVVAEYDPNRYVRQVRLFHDIVGFQKIGVAHEDSEDGRIYANLDSLERVAKERGFEIVACYARDAGVKEDVALAELTHCYEELAPKIDALWVGGHTGEQPQFMPGILAPMFEHKVATWAQVGSEAVRRGALISVAQQSDYTAVGFWYASTMARIFNGAKPRDLDQVFELPLDIAINLETARRLGFEPPEGLLEVADEVYETVEGE